MIITNEMRLLMSVAQRQEETVRILREFVRRQELAKEASARILGPIPPPSINQQLATVVEQPRKEWEQREYADTAPGDL